MKKRNQSTLKFHKKVISNINFENVNGGIQGKPDGELPDPKTVDRHLCIMYDYHSKHN